MPTVKFVNIRTHAQYYPLCSQFDKCNTFLNSKSLSIETSFLFQKVHKSHVVKKRRWIFWTWWWSVIWWHTVTCFSIRSSACLFHDCCEGHNKPLLLPSRSALNCKSSCHADTTPIPSTDLQACEMTRTVVQSCPCPGHEKIKGGAEV